MKASYVLAALLLVFTAVSTAGESLVYDIVEVVKEAFIAEGTFDTHSREKLLEAHDLIVDILDEGDYVDEEYIGAMSLQSLVMYNLACLDAIDGEIEEAFVWLDGAVSAGYTDAVWMAEDSDLEPLRGDPRFEELLDKASEIQENREENWCPGDEEECSCREGESACGESENSNICH